MNNNYIKKELILQRAKECYYKGFIIIPSKSNEGLFKVPLWEGKIEEQQWNFEKFKERVKDLEQFGFGVLTGKQQNNYYVNVLDFDIDNPDTETLKLLPEVIERIAGKDKEKKEELLQGLEATQSGRLHFFFLTYEAIKPAKNKVIRDKKKKDGKETEGAIEFFGEDNKRFVAMYEGIIIEPDKLPVLLRNLPVLSESEANIILEVFGFNKQDKKDKEIKQVANKKNTNVNIDFDKLKEIILQRYTKGNRQNICLFVAGLLRKAGVDLDTTIDFIRNIVLEANDEEFESRLNAVIYTYQKATEEEIKGLSGLEELGYDKNEIVSCLYQNENEEKEISISEKHFETDKAFYSSVFAFNKNKRKRYAFLNKENELWEVVEEINAFTDEKKYMQDKATTLETILLSKNEVMGEVRYSYISIWKEKQIANFSILSGIEHTDELTSEIQYTLNIKTANDKSLKIENITTEDLISKLKLDNLVVSNQKIRDAIAKILSDLIKAQKIRVEQGISKSGFFLSKDNKIIISKLNIREPEQEKLRQALLFATELTEKHFKHTKEKFATILKYFVIAPFSYIARQQKKMIKSLYLYGASGVGKSTMAVISSYIWEDFHRTLEKTGATIDTVARIGNVLSNSTFVEIISEPQSALVREEIIETLKNAITSTIARAKYIQSQYREIPSLSNIVFTSNHFVPTDDALLRRFYVISFSRSERPDRNNDFIEARRNAEELLKEVGNYIAYLIKEQDEYITNQILSINEDNFFDVSKNILEYVYKKSGLEVQPWINYLAKEDYNLQQHENEEKLDILLNLKEIIIRELNSIKFAEEISMRERLELALNQQRISFLLLKNNKVIITREILARLKNKLANLKLLAELMGWEYKDKYSIKLSSNDNKTTNIRAIVFSLQEFIELIFPNEEQEEHQTEQGNQEQQTETETEQSKQQEIINNRCNVVNENIEKAILSIADKIMNTKSRGLTSFEYYELLRSYRINNNIAGLFFEFDGTLFRIKLSDEVKNLALKYDRNDILKYIDENTIDF